MLQMGDTLEDQKIFRASAPPPGDCENMVSALRDGLNLQEKERNNIYPGVSGE